MTASNYPPGVTGTEPEITAPSDDTQAYVLGFAFDRALERVLLVEKQHGPPINIGKLNGVGGKIERGDQSIADAMQREFAEETGIAGTCWTFAGRMSGPGWIVHLFFTNLNSTELMPAENDVGEPLGWWRLEFLLGNRSTHCVAQNVPTIIMHRLRGCGTIEMRVD